MTAYVYILSSNSGVALYVGATTDLRRRLEQHRSNQTVAHTRSYRVHKLVYFEAHETLRGAREREHRVKRWRRVWKHELIASINPQWRDLSDQIPL